MGDRQTDTTRRHVAKRSGLEAYFNRALGERLRELRRGRGLTQEQLADVAGLSRASIANIERAEQTPGLFRLLSICDALGCNVNELVPWEVFEPDSIAASMGDEFSSVVRRVKARASKQRLEASSTP